LRCCNSHGGWRLQVARRGGQKRRRRRVAWPGEWRRQPLPPENHDSARAGGPYATKAILQEEGSSLSGHQ
jgi:hypothetical protein